MFRYLQSRCFDNPEYLGLRLSENVEGMPNHDNKQWRVKIPSPNLLWQHQAKLRPDVPVVTQH
jgi:hypothetical protein